MPHLVRFFLPLRDNSGTPFDSAMFRGIEADLSGRFGGVTAHLEAPASGLWQEGGELHADEVVVFEVMVEAADRNWWTGYRLQLEERFSQKNVLIVLQQVERL